MDEKENPNPRTVEVGSTGQCRQSAMSLLDQIIERKTMELHGLKALKLGLPGEMSQPAENALWNLLVRSS